MARLGTGVCAIALIVASGLSAGAQDVGRGTEARPPNLLAQWFGRRDDAPRPPDEAGQNAGELSIRIDRLESQIRQLTGTIEQLQFRNQQLEAQLRRMQEDADYRQSGGTGRPPAPRPLPPSGAGPSSLPPVAAAPPVAAPAPPPPVAGPVGSGTAGGRRGDAFDPAVSPGAPGAPRSIGTLPGGSPMGPTVISGTGTEAPPPARAELPPAPIRTPGAPLDLTPNQAADDAGLGPRGPGPMGRPVGPAQQQVTLPPSDNPRDAFDLGYGYIQRRDYALAAESFRTFIAQHPTDRQVPDAYYYLGESMYQRQQYRDAAEQFLKISTDYPNAPRAPEALLRLGQSLAALNERETACAAFGEIGRKYPRASQSVKQAVAQEQKRGRC